MDDFIVVVRMERSEFNDCVDESVLRFERIILLAGWKCISIVMSERSREIPSIV